MSSKAMLLSIRPKFAEKIFDGIKCVELRKVKPSMSPGDIVVVYVSSPVKEIRGTFEVEKIIEKPLDELWSFVHNDAGLTKDEFDRYFFGTDMGYGIYLKDVVNITQPISLDDLRKKWSGFHPPQSYMYLSNSQLGMVITSL